MILTVGIGVGSLTASLGACVAWALLRGISPAPAVAPTSAKNVVYSTEEVAAQCEASVGLIRGASSSGTGFLVADGLLATNAHVVAPIPEGQIGVTFPAAPELDRGPLLAKVVYFDRDRDLAILRVATRLKPLRTAGSHTFRRGQDVVVIGNPGIGGEGDSLECVVSRGVIGSRVGEGPLSFYQLSGSVNPGNSGGPVIDMAGRVVGVVTLKARREEGLAFCIPAGDLARATRAAASQSAAAALLAARRHADGSRDAPEAKPDVAEAMRRTEPATWLAMLDANQVLDDGSPEAAALWPLLDRADRLYAEDRLAIAGLVIRMVMLLRRGGQVATARDFLQGSLEWAPPAYFARGRPVKFAEYFQLYGTFRSENTTHQAALASLKSYYRSTAGAFESRPAPDRRGAAPSDRPAADAESAAPELPSTAASANAFRLAVVSEGQKRPRTALRLYRDVVDDNPGTAEAAEASKRIAALAPAPSFRGQRPLKVTSVLDGMTILVDRGGVKVEVKLLGLDPFAGPRPTVPQGAEDRAREFLRSLIGDRSVHLDHERGAGQSDGAGRTLAYIYRADDLLAVNWEMIGRGFAVASKTGTLSRSDEFRDAESRARNRKVGLWAP